jgi:hypothetical protein
MEKNRKCRRLLLRLLPPCLCLALALSLGVGVPQGWGQEKEIASLKPGPVFEAKIREKPRAENLLSLAPFYLIEEEGSRGRVRRVTLDLEFAQPEVVRLLDPQAPRLREIVYDFLAIHELDCPGQDKKGDQKILAGLVNRYLGQEAVTAVKVDQSYLLLP